MTEVLQANIFFFIASFGVIVFVILLSVALYQVIKILRTIRRLIDRIEKGSEMIAEDVSQLKSYVVEGSLLAKVIGFFIGPQAARSRKGKRDS